jgi:hypothetical protein
VRGSRHERMSAGSDDAVRSPIESVHSHAVVRQSV